MRAKYQDNLENMQWFKSFYEKNYAGQPYDPISRRSKGKGADAVPAFALDPARRGPAHTEPEGADAAPSARGVAKASGVASGGSGAAAKAAAPAAVSGARATAPAVVRKPAAAATSGPSTASAAVRSPAHGGGAGQLEAAAARISALTSENAELRLSVSAVGRHGDDRADALLSCWLLIMPACLHAILCTCRWRVWRRSAISTLASCETLKSYCRRTRDQTSQRLTQSFRFCTLPMKTSQRLSNG